MSNEKLRILFVEDVEADRELAEKELVSEKISFVSERVETLEDFRSILETFHPDIILSDYYMPTITGKEIILFAKQLVPGTPVIIVTGSVNEEIAVDCMKAGATDYLLKDKLKRLPFAVMEALGRKDSSRAMESARQALIQSERRFKEISEVTGEFIWEVDASGMYTYANNRSSQTVGYHPDELVGKKYFYDLFGPDFGEQEKVQAFELFARKEVLVNFVNHVMHKDGRSVVVETSGLPILDSSGELMGYRGVDRDITERYQAELLLKSNNENLGRKVEQKNREVYRLSNLNEAIIKNLGLAVISVSTQGLIEQFNPRAESVSGYPGSEVIGKSYMRIRRQGDNDKAIVKLQFTDNAHLADFQPFNQMIAESGSKFFSGEMIFETKHGSEVPVQLTISAIEDEKGQVCGYVCVVADITERQKVFELLKGSEELFRTMFTDHGAIMLLVDPVTGLIEEANKSASRFYGYNFDGPELIHINSINVTEKEFLQLEMEKAVDMKLNYFVFTHRLSDGELKTVEVHSTPIHVKGKKVLFSIIHDITERTRAEELLRKSEAENRAIISTVPDMLFRIDREGVYQECYTSVNSSLYVPREVFIGKNIVEILPEELAKQSMQVLKKAFSTKEIIEYEYQLPVNDKLMHFENRVIAINEEEVLSIIRDITERKVMETSLRWNESLLRLMTGSSPLAFFVVDNRTDEILYFNRRFCEIWGILHLEERMAGRELKNMDIIPDCLLVLQDVNAFAESCKPLQYEDNRVTIEDVIPFNDGRTIRRYSTQIRGENDEYFGRFYIFEDITERKKAEADLQLRESYLSAVINNHPGMFWLKDTNGKFVFINDRNNIFLKNANLTELEIAIGKTDFEFMDTGLAQAYAIEDQRVVESKMPISVEEKIEVDGRNVWYEKFKYPVFDPNGKVIGVSGYSIDISGRKQSEYQLKLQHAAFESFALAMIITDRDGYIEWANPAFTKLTGYCLEESKGKTPAFLKSGEQSNEFYEKFWETLLSGKVWSGELINRKKDGSFYHEEETITPVYDEYGNISRFIAIKIDITHRKEIEEALRISEQRWQFALEGSGDGIWDWNAVTNEVYFSRQWKAMLGFEDHEVSNNLEEWSSRVHPDDLPGCYEELEKHFKGLTPVYISEHRVKCKDGKYKWILDRGTVIDWTADHQPKRVIGTHTDITQIKLLQEKLEATIETERELNEMKTRFVATASHEFRTPLASILIISDTLLEYWKRLEEKQISERLIKIKEQTIHLSSIVDNVLQLSRIQQGKLGYEPAVHDLILLCTQTIEGYSSDPMLLGRIKFRPDISALPMMLDKNLITQAVTNLLSNALKYSAWNEDVKITVAKSDDKVMISVSDKGMGIPDDDLKHLFTPFFRASNTRLIQGNGLGLNIVMESIKMHGGDVTVDSKAGKGSTFNIILPESLIAKS